MITKNIMKKLNSITLLLLMSLVFLGACEQELIELTDPDPNTTNVEPLPCTGTAGSANFSKFIAIGNSFVAGMQGGALFTTGQNNSLAKIIHTQLVCAGGSATFNQPDINASLGWNLFFTQPFLTDQTKPILGRMLLQGAPPRPTPQPYPVGVIEALPNPAVNPGFMYSGNKATLNNFSVPAITVGQALITQTGNWALAGIDPRFSPFYGRFASSPGASTMVSDARAAKGSFILVWLGLDDFFLHAAFGGDPTLAPLTTVEDFGTRIGAVFGHPDFGLFTDPDNATSKAIIGNFPDIFKMPHFTAITFNPIPLDQATADALNAGFAGYNAAIEGLKNPGFGGAFGTNEQLEARKVSFIVGNNKALIKDEYIQNLAAGFDALLGLGAITAQQRAQLAPYEQVRQTKTTDIIPLGTGAVLGTPGTFGVLGISEPLADRFVLVQEEINAINAARTGYNAVVNNVATAFTARLGVADINAAMTSLVNNQFALLNGVTLTPNINPPTGIYSEDGAHFNTRGYAFIAKTFIEAINAKFGSTVLVPNMSKYSATGLPIP
jgi:hypothetical protein